MPNNENNDFWQFFSERPRSEKKTFGMIDQDRKKPLGGTYANHSGNSDQEEDYLSFYDCGHPGHREPGGRCLICGAIICAECSKKCANCGIPVLCPQDIYKIDNSDVCLNCADELRWNMGIKKVWAIISSPFRKSHD